jgi:hypothetical protein
LAVKIVLQHIPPESGHRATRLACPFCVKSGHYTDADHCLGRSRGGLTTKIHAVVDAQGLPIRLGLTTGQAHDGQIADTLLNQLGPHTIVLADKAYDADRIRQLIRIKAQRPTSRPRATGAGNPASASGSTASATSSSASSPS